jgi:hypothetical protein
MCIPVARNRPVVQDEVAAIVAFATPAVRGRRTASCLTVWQPFMPATELLDAYH